jgi:hypothetical protein
MSDNVYILRAGLVGHRGISRKLAVRGDETLADLHQLLQFAFEWDDDDLYCFWLSDKFWDRTPGIRYADEFWGLDDDSKSSRLRLDRLGLKVGDKLSYLFDFGDQWRVRLRVLEIRPASAGPYPAILESRGEAPPRYWSPDEELAEHA